MPKGIHKDKKPEYDHLGNKFYSFLAMCDHYNKPLSTVKGRLKRNWTLEQALTVDNSNTKHKINHKKIWHDHKGNAYTSLPEMCHAYNITEKIYQSRVRLLKWDLEKTLTTPLIKTPKNAKTATDHLGQTFPSVSEMCRYHNVKLSRFKERIKAGWDVEKALTTPAKKINSMEAKTCQDHLGNIYNSQNEMCRKYNIKRHTLRSRLELGWSLEQALTGDYVINNITITDHMNREFPTLKDMANFYALNAAQLQGNKTLQNNIYAELAKMIKNKYHNLQLGPCFVIKCITFPYFKIKIQNVNYIMHLEKILELYHNSDDFQPLLKTKIAPQIKIIRRIKFPYYIIEENNIQVAKTYWAIIKDNTENSFGIKKKNAAD